MAHDEDAPDVVDLNTLTDEELQAIINDGDDRIQFIRAEMRAAVTVIRSRAGDVQFAARTADLSDEDRARIAREETERLATAATGE